MAFMVKMVMYDAARVMRDGFRRGGDTCLVLMVFGDVLISLPGDEG